jgi:hypothetical protein
VQVSWVRARRDRRTLSDAYRCACNLSLHAPLRATMSRAKAKPGCWSSVSRSLVRASVRRGEGRTCGPSPGHRPDGSGTPGCRHEARKLSRWKAGQRGWRVGGACPPLCSPAYARNGTGGMSHVDVCARSGAPALVWCAPRAVVGVGGSRASGAFEERKRDRVGHGVEPLDVVRVRAELVRSLGGRR